MKPESVVSGSSLRGQFPSQRDGSVTPQADPCPWAVVEITNYCITKAGSGPVHLRKVPMKRVREELGQGGEELGKAS